MKIRTRKITARKATQGGPLSFPWMATGTATEEDIYEALEEVIDPELGLDFGSLGPQVSEQMREFVGQLQGVDKVHPKMVFDPPWSPEMMSEDAKFALGY